MALRKATPLQFSPYGVSDAVDSTNVFPGAMAALTNLIPDPTTRNLWMCRPAAVKIADFNSGGPFSSGWSSGFQHSPFGAGITSVFVSALLVVGTRAYGMIATNQFAGHDVPFSFDLANNSFDVITGTTSANTPVSPPSSGPWTPPSMALVGTKIIVTHPGFNFAGGFAFGVIDVSTPATPTWTATNTATNALVALPQWVANFNGRAYFLVNPAGQQPAAYFTDILNPTNITNANQIITFDDNQPLTCAAGLGLFNQLGGIAQSLMVFKGSANVYQITGDAALSNLAKNSLNIATGTQCPLSVTPTPKGLAFLAPDGLRIIDFDARISDPIGVDGQGVNLPFLNPVVPTRVNISCNQNVLRVSVQNSNVAGAPQQEWWYDISRTKWSGPHTFPASMIAPYNDTFIMTPIAGSLATLWQSDVVQSATSTFVENGQQLTWSWSTSFLPDPKQMAEFQMTETTINMALPSSVGTVQVQAVTQQNLLLDFVSLSAPGAPPIWGQFNWGTQLWGGASAVLSHQPLPWHQPLVFSRLQITASGTSAQGFKIGDMFLRYQQTGYLQRYAGAA